MTLETERLIHENAPTAAQLRRLARIGLGHAASRNKLRSVQDSELKPLFRYFTDDLYGEFDESEEGITMINHRIAMRFGLASLGEGDATVAHLHYFDTKRAYPVFGERLPPLQTVYKFEWSRGKVLLAEKSMRLLGYRIPEPRSLESYLDSMVIPESIAPIEDIEALDSLSHVTEQHCDEIIGEASAYFSRIKDRETV